MSADIVPIRSKSRQPAVAAPKARVSLVNLVERDPVEFVVGIEYETGEYVLAGVYHDYAHALDVARWRAAALGIQAVDFTDAGAEAEGGAA
ncbi:MULTISPECIES: hypothetical protein [unclassified Sphingomonas]|uniref:hypothetical protein n=1 Tax=unclassified Sphingomonas TaxID=196159 RepID=UPI002150901C|nr:MULTISPECIES: hypothetical protein [unclassified Sphingomonas]MCR5872247.1 hypothetical protein [Sphingomonas sp. J344]UUX99446.1 hypothetical protein LRS08_18725 [Sphingomonas sp. J315]